MPEELHSVGSHVTGDEKILPLGARRSSGSGRAPSFITVDSDVDNLDRIQRLATRNSVASQVINNPLYRQESRISVEGLDEMPVGEEFEKEDPNLVTWDGEDDPENPRNWKSRRKWKLTILASLQTLVPTISSSIISPAVPNILADFNNSNSAVGSLLVGIMVLVWGVSAIIWAPLSEVYGRRWILIISGFGNLVFNICCAVSPTTATMLVFRALAGAFNSAPIGMGAGTLADIFSDEDRQWPMGLWAIAPSCGPGISPIIGGFIAQYTSWSWAYWVIVILQGATLVALFIFFDESYPVVLLKRKKRRLIKQTGNKDLYTVWDLLTSRPSFWEEAKIVLWRPLQFLLLTPVITLLAVYLAYSYGFMYIIIADYYSLWTDVYHYSAGISGTMYIAYVVGNLAGALVWPNLLNWWIKRQQRLGKSKLEDKLFWLPVSTIFLSGGFFWYGWSAQAHIHWIMPEIGIALFCFGIFCVFQCVQTYAASLNARLAGSALAALVLGRSLVGGVAPIFGRPMFINLGYGWASTIVALLAIILGIPWPIGIFIYGPRLRAWADKRFTIA